MVKRLGGTMVYYTFEEFNGFSRETFEFLKNLGKNNSKPWFEKHRDVYDTSVLKPLRQLVMELGDFMLTIDAGFETQPAVNKTISRIYRDTRFSKDKSLFRTNMWIVFKNPDRNWKSKPGYFFEIYPDSYRYGMGFYSPSSGTMAKLRAKIDAESPDVMQVIQLVKDQNIFELAGDKYKRIFDPGKPPEIQEWYQRKDLYLVCNRPVDDLLFSNDLVNVLIKDFQLIAPVYQLLRNISK
ncbi:MAG: DUF2461 domain-containing protein [bacterium]